MQKHGKPIAIFMLLLMVAWYAPMVINDNIASAYITYANHYGLKLVAERYEDRSPYFGVANSQDGKYVYACSVGWYDYPGLRVYDATSHNLITWANESGGSCYYNRLWVNGNYIFVTRTHGLSAYYFSYATLTLTFLDNINTTDPESCWDVSGDSSYIYTTNWHYAPDYYQLRAYSFDYGASNTFTWLSSYNGTATIHFRNVVSDGTYVYTAGWQNPYSVCAFLFSGSSFTLINSISVPTGVTNDCYIDTISGLLYVASREDGINVYSFNGFSFTLEYNRNDGDFPIEVSGDDSCIYTGGIQNPYGTYRAKVSAYSKYQYATMNLLGTWVSPIDLSDVNDISAYNLSISMVDYEGLYLFKLIPYLPPTVNTNVATNVTTTTATLNGNIVDNGGWDFTEYGFIYGLTTGYEKGYITSTGIQETLELRDTINNGVYSDVCSDGNGNVFTVCGTDGLRAYTYDGNTFVLKDTSYAGGDYRGVTSVVKWGSTYVFVACGGDGLRAYQYNSTLGLSLITTIDDGGTYNAVWWDFPNLALYVARGSSGLSAYTFNGATFTLKTTTFTGTQDYIDVCGDANGVYVCCGTEGLRAYTYTGIAFVPHGSSWGGGSYLRCYPKAVYSTTWGWRNYIFVACSTLGLVSYTFIATVLTPRTLQYDGTEPYNDVWSDGTYIYCACGTEGVRAYTYGDGITFTLRATQHDGTGSDYNTVWGDNETNIVALSDSNGMFAYWRLNIGSYTYNLAGLIPDTIYHYRAFTNNTYETGYGIDRLLYTSSSTGIALDFNINVYNESNGAQGLPFSIMIKNINGSQVYSLVNQHNTLHINTSALTGNQNVLMKVWSNGYRERIITIPIYNNSLTANYTFYLPAEEMPPGDDPGGGSSYLPNASIIPFIYNLRVVETIRTEYQEFDRPISGAWVSIRRFINTTGDFELMSRLTTDTNGYCNLYLIPSVLYIFDITATLYDNATSDWNPSPPSPYSPTEVKIFRMTRTGQTILPVNYTYLMKNLTYSLEPTGTRQEGAITFYYNITSYDNQLQWFRMTVSYYNVTTHTWSTLYSHNTTNAHGGSISYTTPNVTGEYKVDVWFKKNGFNEYKIYQTGSLHYTIIYINSWIRAIPSFVYYLVLIVIMIIVMGYCFASLGTGFLTGYIGLGIMAFGLLLKPDLVVNNFGGWTIWAITFIIYTMGLFLWSRL